MGQPGTRAALPLVLGKAVYSRAALDEWAAAILADKSPASGPRRKAARGRRGRPAMPSCCPGPLLTIPAAARRIGVGRRHIRAAIDAGELPAVEGIGKRRRVAPEDLDA